MLVVIDLNSGPDKTMLLRLSRKERTDEFWPNDLCTTNGLSSYLRVSPLRRTLPRQLQTQELLLLGSISVHGLRATDLSREPARYRSLSACESNQALSSGHSRSRFTQYACECQLSARLAHLRRLRASAHQYRPPALSQRRLRHCPGTNRLRAGRHHHRFVPIVVSVGLLSPSQRRCQTAHPARPPWQYSNGRHYYSRPDSRCPSARRAYLRAGRFLCDGSRLPRLSATAPIAS